MDLQKQYAFDIASKGQELKSRLQAPVSILDSKISVE